MADPIAVEHRVPGWELVWARLTLRPGAPTAADRARTEQTASARERFAVVAVSEDPTVAAVRRLFRAAGTDPTRYRPSSEALLRRVLRGEELPAIHPLVDLNNCLSIALAVPSCVMAAGSFGAGVRLRRGTRGERLDSLRGDFDLEDKLVLEDDEGPFGTPITDSRRVAVQPATTDGWLVAYLPQGGPGVEAVERALRELDSIASASDLFATAGTEPHGARSPGAD